MPDSLLSDSIIPPYRPSEDDGYINDYCQEELVAARMSGPFSDPEMHSLCKGHFAACPVHVVVTTDKFGKIKHCIIHNISFHGMASFSVNDLVDSDDFPTKWGMASIVANIMSFSLLLSPSVAFWSSPLFENDCQYPLQVLLP